MTSTNDQDRLEEARRRLALLGEHLAARRTEQAEAMAVIAKAVEEIRRRVAMITLRAANDEMRAGVAADGTARQLQLYDRDVDHLQPVPPWLADRPVVAMHGLDDGPPVAQQREVLLAGQVRVAELTAEIEIVANAHYRAARALAARGG